MSRPITVRSPEGDLLSYHPTTLAELGLKESELERAIASDPGLLCLEEAGIHWGNVHVVSQSKYKTLSGRGLRPDLLMITDHGDVIAV